MENHVTSSTQHVVELFKTAMEEVLDSTLLRCSVNQRGMAGRATESLARSSSKVLEPLWKEKTETLSPAR